MNTVLLREALAVMQAHPHRVDMDTYFNKADCSIDQLVDPDCSSVGCIAGHIVALRASRNERPQNGYFMRYEYEAALALGVTLSTAAELFFVHKWPVPFRTQYNRARSAATRIRAITACVEHFIATHSEETTACEPSES